MKIHNPVLLIACGALAREIQTIKHLNGWKGLVVRYLPAQWHNTPERISVGIRKHLEKIRIHYKKIYVAYADCGTGGKLDLLLKEYGIERLPGAHCYEFFSGTASFSELANEELGTFYLTDFLVRSFDRLVIKELGLDEHPQLRDEYFRNYRRLVYLAQTNDLELQNQAQRAAEQLRLEYQYRYTGCGELGKYLEKWIISKANATTNQNFLARHPSQSDCKAGT